LKVERNYKDLVEKTIITSKSDFIEKLTHDSYVVQVERITNRYQTRLDKLLSIFEQKNFVDDKQIVKNFTHNPDIEEVKIITDILHYVGTDPEEKRKIEIEQEAWRTVNAMFEEKERKYLQQLAEKNKALNEKDMALNEKDKALNEKDKLIEELLKKLNEQK
jgi:septal ring factor EnvC (AmiA/AmiB activator)